ncbi:tRNA 2-thiocytidine(32) synthetase TtcA [Oxalobacter vibrioformis]|uniref:tRNA-cytidine(32) 2-sulfurtransferase n=1 Tax=Oxalobacter vibrioformis TaxID=933080 RepID=A0A9E9LYE8_9BURK|nr:tRNA 2-thiocytidine(32) synthetase TtcA [Oxalobacter vibrioformis]WAW11179.1 tRNA 2-thiocytidine(32) synthetase TtcA [Oxalobacter vibrioformis]
MTKAITRRQFKKTGYENTKLRKRLCRLTGQAIGDFNMIEAGDKVMVCLSGGKDSFCLLDILLVLQSRAPIHFDIIAVNLNQKQPGFPADILPRYLQERGIAYHIEEEDTYSIMKRLIPEGKAGCSLCARLRRGILYRVASEIGATKIALGHHRDDIIETFFLNLFFGAKLKGMPAKLLTDDGRHIVIRPLAYVKESDLVRYADKQQFPLIPCNFCGPFVNQQRSQIKALMREWEKRFPGRVENIFSALSTLVPSHLMDKHHFDFGSLSAEASLLPDTMEMLAAASTLPDEGDDASFPFVMTS